jgi:hypothetical protein
MSSLNNHEDTFIIRDDTRIDKEKYKGYDFKRVAIPDTVKEIGPYAFYGCSNLTEITIPASVLTIGHSAFENCTLLNKVTIKGDNLKLIGKNAFKECKITEITTQKINDRLLKQGRLDYYGLKQDNLYITVEGIKRKRKSNKKKKKKSNKKKSIKRKQRKKKI